MSATHRGVMNECCATPHRIRWACWKRFRAVIQPAPQGLSELRRMECRRPPSPDSYGRFSCDGAFSTAGCTNMIRGGAAPVVRRRTRRAGVAGPRCREQATSSGHRQHPGCVGATGPLSRSIRVSVTVGGRRCGPAPTATIRLDGLRFTSSLAAPDEPGAQPDVELSAATRERPGHILRAPELIRPGSTALPVVESGDVPPKVGRDARGRTASTPAHRIKGSAPAARDHRKRRCDQIKRRLISRWDYVSAA